MTQPNLLQLRRRPVDQLYHQFLKPQGISKDKVNDLMILMIGSGFINPVHTTMTRPQYVETSRLTSGQNKDELFKIIHSLKES